MFDTLKNQLSGIFQKFKGKGRVTDSDISQVMREIRISLLEADVALDAVKALVAQVKEKVTGQEILKSLSPEQVLIKAVHDELVQMLSAGNASDTNLNITDKHLNVILLTGLQGSGKTTTAAKLAFWLKKQGRKPLMTSLDVYRPAAQQQLEQLAHANALDVTPITQEKSPLNILKSALTQAKMQSADVLLVDTAGRSQIDATLMHELVQIKAACQPSEILFVADATLGQDALPIAQAFHEAMDLTGHVLTRTDGDARGGSALSIGFVTQKPLKFLGTSEHIDGLELFDPKRQASRILDQGDVVTLVEEIEKAVDQEDVAKAQEALTKGVLTLDDMEKQLKSMQKLGSFKKILGALPGMGGLQDKMAAFDEEEAKKDLKHKLAIIRSMHREEKRNPSLLNASRRRRIASGSGTSVQALNLLMKQFQQTQAMMQHMKNGQAGTPLPSAFKRKFGSFKKRFK